MNREHLLKIINNTFRKTINPIDDTFKKFNELYEPIYAKIPIKKEYLVDCIVFNPQENGLDFSKGYLSCTGLEFTFTHKRFVVVSVCVFWDFLGKKVYNQVLALPKYTQKDFNGKKRIKQSSVKVTSDKDLQKYFNKLFKRFECPEIGFP